MFHEIHYLFHKNVWKLIIINEGIITHLDPILAAVRREAEVTLEVMLEHFQCLFVLGIRTQCFAPF